MRVKQLLANGRRTDLIGRDLWFDTSVTCHSICNDDLSSLYIN